MADDMITFVEHNDTVAKLEGDLIRARVELTQLRSAVERLQKERDAAVSELAHVRATMPVLEPHEVVGRHLAAQRKKLLGDDGGT